MKNNAQAPYPDGEEEFLVDKFTGTIMRIELPPKTEMKQLIELNTDFEYEELILKNTSKYPTFPAGRRVIEVLNEVMDDEM